MTSRSKTLEMDKPRFNEVIIILYTIVKTESKSPIPCHSRPCTWSSTSLHAVSWACLHFFSLSEQLTRILQCLFYKLALHPSSFMIMCLSSSQELGSACLLLEHFYMVKSCEIFIRGLIESCPFSRIVDIQNLTSLLKSIWYLVSVFRCSWLGCWSTFIQMSFKITVVTEIFIFYNQIYHP